MYCLESSILCLLELANFRALRKNTIYCIFPLVGLGGEWQPVDVPIGIVKEAYEPIIIRKLSRKNTIYCTFRFQSLRWWMNWICITQ